MSQRELKKGKLLDDNGNLIEAGYATSLVKEYDRNAIKANALRIKEWDYYYIGNKDFGIAVTIADNSYMSLASISFLDFQSKKQITKSYMRWLTLGAVCLPSTSITGDVALGAKNYSLEFYNDNGKRHLVVFANKFDKKDSFNLDVVLEETNGNSMVISTPFNKPKHFYYNQKINNLRANGFAKIGSKVLDLNNSYGVLDWGRGVWTYKNTWYWSSLSGECDGHIIGFNLGYGFGDTSNASENMLFVDKKVYKLEDVLFNIPKLPNGKDDFMSCWTFTSRDDAINLTFTPILDRFADSNVLLIRSLQNQVFGFFNGTIKTIDGDIKISNMLGFAEKVFNKW